MMHPADTSDDAVAATDGQPWKRSRRTDGHDTSVARTPVLMLAIRHEGLMIEKEESLLQGQNLVQAVVHPRNADEVVGALRTWHPRVLLVSGMHYGAGIPFATGHPPMSDDMLTAAIADAARVAPIEVVFLNCCTSWKLCQDLQSAHNIPVVVGWDGDAQTSHCIAVCVGFFRMLALGVSYADAFEGAMAAFGHSGVHMGIHADHASRLKGCRWVLDNAPGVVMAYAGAEASVYGSCGLPSIQAGPFSAVIAELSKLKPAPAVLSSGMEPWR